MKSAEDTKAREEQLGFLEITILVLSVYVLGALLVQTTFNLSPEVNALLDGIDFIVCVVFLADFCIRFRRAPSKLAFLKWGWIDLVSSLPAFDFLRWGRLLRVIRIIRILRAFRSTKHLMAFLYRNRAKSLIGTAALSAVVLVIFSCIAILAFENEKESNIKTPFDCWLWRQVSSDGRRQACGNRPHGYRRRFVRRAYRLIRAVVGRTRVEERGILHRKTRRRNPASPREGGPNAERQRGRSASLPINCRGILKIWRPCSSLFRSFFAAPIRR